MPPINIRLKASNGQYLSAQPGGGGIMNASGSPPPGDWQTFRLTDLFKPRMILSVYAAPVSRRGPEACVFGRSTDGCVRPSAAPFSGRRADDGSRGAATPSRHVR
jgi:hypothetical protein